VSIKSLDVRLVFTFIVRLQVYLFQFVVLFIRDGCRALVLCGLRSMTCRLSTTINSTTTCFVRFQRGRVEEDGVTSACSGDCSYLQGENSRSLIGRQRCLSIVPFLEASFFEESVFRSCHGGGCIVVVRPKIL
jgi:hypothetical protein